MHIVQLQLGRMLYYMQVLIFLRQRKSAAVVLLPMRRRSWFQFPHLENVCDEYECFSVSRCFYIDFLNLCVLLTLGLDCDLCLMIFLLFIYLVYQ